MTGPASKGTLTDAYKVRTCSGGGRGQAVRTPAGSAPARRVHRATGPVPLLASLAREVGLSELQLGLVLTVAAVVFAGTSLLWGRAVDRFGTRAVLLVGLALATAGVIGASRWSASWLCPGSSTRASRWP
ncbi:MFS transporter [Pseudonocardia sichuanensis]|uniref:MFS transporter n=1 Tax=Pseudonocardia kunmingensis TaxID=630975 RepID=UPI0011537728